MTTKKWTAKEGRVPGPGKWQQDVTERPDDTSLFSRAQLVGLVGVSNGRVISRVIESLGITPVAEGHKTRTTYNNGGYGQRSFDVPYFTAVVADKIREELRRNSVEVGAGRFSYAGTTFVWTS
jgi:hypothetical protein